MTSDSKERFSNRAADYVKYRPGYPMAIIDFLQRNYGLYGEKKIADVGAGTGISSSMFLLTGYDVIAVEPNREMREMAIAQLSTYPGFEVIDGAAEHTGLPDASVDAVVCGQAFHWFDMAAAKKEFKRILRSDGIVVLMWNERKVATDFETKYEALILKHGKNYVQVDHRNIDLEHIQDFFKPEPCHLEVFQNSQVFDFAGLEGRLLSSSYMPARNDVGYPAMKAGLKALFDEYQAQGHITIHYDTKVYVCRV